MQKEAKGGSRIGAWSLRVLGLGLLLWLLGQAQWGELADLWARLEPVVLYLSPSLTIVLFLLRAWRWKLLIGQHNRQPELSLWRAWSIYAIGFFLGVITPGRLGDMAKAAYVGGAHDLSFERALAGTLVDRILDLGFLACLLAWAIFQLGLWSWWQANALGWSAYVVLSVMAGSILVLLLRSVRVSLSRRILASRWGEFALRIGGEMGELANRTGLFAIGITCVAYGVYFSHTYLLASQLGLELSFADVAAATVLIGLAAFLPLSVAGLGTREGVLVLVMIYKGVPNSLEAALAFAALFFLACYVFPALLGLGCWLLNPLSLTDLRARAGWTDPRT